MSEAVPTTFRITLIIFGILMALWIPTLVDGPPVTRRPSGLTPWKAGGTRLWLRVTMGLAILLVFCFVALMDLLPS